MAKKAKKACAYRKPYPGVDAGKESFKLAG